MAISSHVYNSKSWKLDNRWFFSTKLFCISLHHKSGKVDGNLVWIITTRGPLCGMRDKIVNDSMEIL